MAHLLPAWVNIRRGKQSSVLVFQAFGGIQRERKKKPTKTKQNQNKNAYMFPHESCPVPRLFHSLDTGGQNFNRLLWKTHAQIYTHTHTHSPGGAFCQMSNFPNFLSRVVSGRSSRSSRSAGPHPGEFPIAIPSLADRPGWLHSLQPSSKAPQ